MKNAWPRVRVGEVLRQIERPEPVDASRMYRLFGVRWYGQGLFVREEKIGADIAANRVYAVRPGDFIYNRLFAWKGSFAVAGAEASEAYVSNEFPCFAADATRLDPYSLLWFFRQGRAWAEVPGLSTGATPTSRNRLKETEFLAMEIPLPPLSEQHRVVARIEKLALHIHQARALRARISDETEALFRAGLVVSSSHGSFALRLVGDVCRVIDPNPSHRYPAYVPRGVPIISSSDFVGEDSIDLSRARHVAESFYQETLGRFGVGEGDVIFSRKGKVGYARAHPPSLRLAMTHTLCVMQPNRAVIEPRYLLHFTRSRAFLDALTGTMNPNAGVPTLGLAVVREAAIPLPSIQEQQRIVADLDALQAEAGTLNRLQTETAAELDALLRSVLNRAFK